MNDARQPERLPDRLEHLSDLPYQRYLLFFGAIRPKKNVDRLGSVLNKVACEP